MNNQQPEWLEIPPWLWQRNGELFIQKEHEKMAQANAAQQIDPKPVVKYKPETRLEALIFYSTFCAHCTVNLDARDGSKGHCRILRRARLYPATHPIYPQEIIRDRRGIPNCTRFELNPHAPDHRSGMTPDMFSGAL